MVYQESSPKDGWVLVTFTCPVGLWLDQLSVVGDFNGWDPRASPLAFSQDGTTRTVTLNLPAGRRYRFVYLADGVRCLEPRADGVVPDAPGGLASVLTTRRSDKPGQNDATDQS